MKTALCLSGHLRTFRYTFEALKVNVIDPLNCDVFIHTWDVIGAPTGKNPGDIKNETAQTVDCLQDIYGMLNPKFMSIEDQKDKLDGFISATNDIVVPAHEQQYIMKHVGLHVSMFYSLYMANSLKNEYEQENNIKYDLVVRCRPDIFFKTKLNFDMFPDSNKIYVPDIATYVEGGINDQVAIGSSQVLDQYSDIYNHVANYYRHHACVARPEVMIKYHLDRLGVPSETRDIDYDLYRLDGAMLKQHKMHAEWAPGNFHHKRM
jgi:hypothetical protein